VRAVAKWLQPVVLVGFLLPFLVVSCNGQTVVQSEGWRLAFGVAPELSEELAELAEEQVEANEPGDFWVSSAFFLAVAAAVAAFTRLPSRVLAILATLIVASAVAFWVRITADLEATVVLGWKVSPGLGFWWVAVLGLGCGVLFLTDHLRQGAPFPNREADGLRSAAGFCPQCGDPRQQSDQFCANCGTPLRT
jgi:hypothetical protein